MDLQRLLGYLLCAAGIVLGIASVFKLGWGWGVLAVLLFLFGWYLLRLARERDSGSDVLADVVEAVVDAVDFD